MRWWQVDLITQTHCTAGRSVFHLFPLAGPNFGAVIFLRCGYPYQIWSNVVSRKETSSSGAERVLAAKSYVGQDIVTVK